MKNILISFLLLSVFFSCRQEIVERVSFKRIPNEMKAYWNFKPGTYWIYKDSISNYIDSVYVSDLKLDSGYGFQGKQKIVFQALQLTTLNLNGDEIKYRVTTTYTQNKAENFSIVYANKTIHNPNYYFVGENTSFIYPYLVGLTSENTIYSYPYNDTCVLMNLFPLYNGFADVIEFKNTRNAFEYANKSFSYYAKNIGLIKYEVPDSNKFRRLISYHIVQ